ncbi:GNAT family N-acetyltransferase [Brevibacillus sp. SYP-B805]|uniref:GNAT family N-acetyltransferase n=1 Tax=Brevibacillus sp. SYP-B805 TaxID=1578199 RepID=UPI0013EC4118|nr:GNAT family N-acetyltransferase [Brevibacillus sp. SYP-B805]NGQ96619.1 GNAT family N-acetyltransferase [Brevibacillus sp. SYP-B805]
MSHLAYAVGYSSDDAMREKLYPLFEQVFGIEVSILADFHRRGFWNPTYRPYTFFDGEAAVANVSMFTLPLMVQGSVRKAAGIQSVMTHPEYRGKGLMKQLFRRMLEEIDQAFDASFLLTDQPELYKPFGFRVVQEYTFAAPIGHFPKQEGDAVRKLDAFAKNDLRWIRERFARHQPLSWRFAPVGYASSFFLNMYHPAYQKKLYAADDLGVIVVYEVEEETLRLYDCIGENLPPLEALCSRIPEPFSRIEFHFPPDRFHGAAEPVPAQKRNLLMVRGRFELDNLPLRLPITAAF